MPDVTENEVLRVMPILRLLTPIVCACLLTACIEAPEGAGSPLESQAFAAGGDDSHAQGTELHGTPVRSAAYSGAVVPYGGTYRGAPLRLVKGELVADLPLQVSGTTPSLQSCFLRATGPERGCGFTVEGQGVCTPRTTVLLTSGACAGQAGSCTGKPVVRVCSGEQPCEHEGLGYLATGTYSCASTCPSVKFTCPSSGIYTVLAGPYSIGQTWSLTMRTSTGTYPAASKELRGEQLVGTRLNSNPVATWGQDLEIADVINAAQVSIPESPGIWDSSGDTFLYHVRRGTPSTGYTAELCTSSDAGTGGNGAWAVPVRGLFNLDGSRTDSTTAFTFGCDTGVIAKCYRWGYKPWLDGAQTGNVTLTHHACTRMARADYCGDGTSFTQDGTRIRPWDNLAPAIISPPAPDAGTGDMRFEAGWRPGGPVCLSHWRWATLQASCVRLKPPIYGSDGGIENHCLYQPPDSPYHWENCAQVCDTPEEAAQYVGERVFNLSGLNGADEG